MVVREYILFILSISMVVYWIFGNNHNAFWHDYFYTSITLLTGFSLLTASNIIVNIFRRNVIVFISFCFIILGIFQFYKMAFWIALNMALLLIAYGVITRLIFLKKIESDKYNETDNFIIFRKPKYQLEFIRAYLFVDTIGSIKVVKRGNQYGFRKIGGEVHYHNSRHTYNPRYYTYVKTDKKLYIKNRTYNFIKNNCLNCWNLNIKKEIS